MASTPTIKGVSRIELAWRESDQRDYFVPCPKCGHYQVLVFGDGTGPGLVWPEGKPEDAVVSSERYMASSGLSSGHTSPGPVPVSEHEHLVVAALWARHIALVDFRSTPVRCG